MMSIFQSNWYGIIYEKLIEKNIPCICKGDPYGHPIQYTPECDFQVIHGCHTMLL